MKRLSLAVLCCLLLAGCIFEPVFDASSWIAYQRSSAAVKAKLDSNDLRRLEVAIKYLFMENLAKTAGQSLTNVAALPNDIIVNQYVTLIRLAPKLNGRTGAAVIRDLTIKLDAEISEMESARQNFDNAGAIEIGSPNYYWRTSGRLEQPTVEFSVRNGTKAPVSRVYLSAVLISPGRSIPWAKQDFVQTFKGGLEPREKQQLTIEPRGGDWSDKQLKYLPDAELKVVVTNFEDANGQRVLPTGSDDLELKRKVRAMLQ